jgi:hypothetical protein
MSIPYLIRNAPSAALSLNARLCRVAAELRDTRALPDGSPKSADAVRLRAIRLTGAWGHVAELDRDGERGGRLAALLLELVDSLYLLSHPVERGERRSGREAKCRELCTEATDVFRIWVPEMRQREGQQ